MSQFDNSRNFQPSYKTMNFWLKILKSDTIVAHENTHFVLPALFKAVTPIIKIYLIGVVIILILEGYATFGVALDEGVPLKLIIALIFVDFIVAFIPHLFFDGKICLLKNNKFIKDFSIRYERVPEPNKSVEQMNIESMDESDQYHAKIKLNVLIKNLLLYIFLIGLCCGKLWIFFSTYPFFNTYQAYIVFICYILATILHIICTGHVINYWILFNPRLNREKRTKRKSQNKGEDGLESFVAKLNSKEINATFIVETAKALNQEIVREGDTFKLKTTGTLFDEELYVLINAQKTEAQKFAVAVTGKMVQTSILDK
jgi:hypothetical protein